MKPTLSIRLLTPLRDAPWVPERKPDYDPFLDEILDVRCPPLQWYMTRWQMCLVGFGIAPEQYDPISRRYGPDCYHQVTNRHYVLTP